jgi:hypothetical protein
MEKMTEKQILRQVDENLTGKAAELLVTSLVDCLWGKESDLEWGPDTMEAIANLLDGHGFGPTHVVGEE